MKSHSAGVEAVHAGLGMLGRLLCAARGGYVNKTQASASRRYCIEAVTPHPRACTQPSSKSGAAVATATRSNTSPRSFTNRPNTTDEQHTDQPADQLIHKTHSPHTDQAAAQLLPPPTAQAQPQVCQARSAATTGRQGLNDKVEDHSCLGSFHVNPQSNSTRGGPTPSRGNGCSC